MFYFFIPLFAFRTGYLNVFLLSSSIVVVSCKIALWLLWVSCCGWHFWETETTTWPNVSLNSHSWGQFEVVDPGFPRGARQLANLLFWKHFAKNSMKKMKEFGPCSACPFGSATDLSRDEEKSHSKNLTKLERGDEKFLLGRWNFWVELEGL